MPKCIHCEGSYSENKLVSINKKLICHECFSKAEKEITRSHTYKPEFKKFSCVGEKNTLFMGFEVEVESVNTETEDIIFEIKLRELDGFLYTKWDGSLSDGCEIVSQPFSYNYFNSFLFEKLCGFFLYLNKNFSAYKMQTAGIHFHLSRNFFSPEDLVKLRIFFATNSFPIKILSARTSSTRIFRYCRFEELNRESFVKQMHQSLSYFPRYTALNLSNKDTVEIRIFSGTTNFQYFLAYLDFSYSLSKFIKKCSLEKMIADPSGYWKKYIKFLDETEFYDLLDVFQEYQIDTDLSSILKKTAEISLNAKKIYTKIIESEVDG
jgi:hypothetical protein